MFGLHSLLWDLRRHPDLAGEYAASAATVLDRYELSAEERSAFLAQDYGWLYRHGVNPYLLYFCALQLGVERAAYYAAIRDETAKGSDRG